MGTSNIQAAIINSIPAKMENFRKAFEILRSYSAAVEKFTFLWKDIEDHFSSIEKSIEGRFRELEEKMKSSALQMPAAAAPAALKVVEEKENQEEFEPRPELKSLCVKMDGKGLRLYISDNQKDFLDIRSELVPALRCAPDPVTLVIDSLDDFVSSKGVRRVCVALLECLHRLAPGIKPLARERARGVAMEWKQIIADGKGNSAFFLGFLQLVVTFELVSSFSVDDILVLLVAIARRKQTVDLCRSAGLQEKMPDLVEKLINEGKQAEAVKFVLAFNLVDKYSPAFLLQSYLKESRKAAQAVRQKGNNSSQAKNEANAKEIAALKEVVSTVEDYKLGSVYSCENHLKRIEQLEKETAGMKRAANVAATATLNLNVKARKQQLQRPNKRSRPSTAASDIPVHTPSQSQPYFGLLDRTPYMGLSGSYGLTPASSLYNHSSSNLSGTHVGIGGTRTPPQPYLYLFPSQAASGTSAYGDRALTYVWPQVSL